MTSRGSIESSPRPNTGRGWRTTAQLVVGLIVIVAGTFTAGNAQAGETASFDLVTAAADGSGPSIGQYGLNPITMSNDARYVALRSDATTLVPSDTNGQPDIFVRDRTTGTTVRANLPESGAEHSQADGGDYAPRLSGDGRHVAFLSYSDSLVTGDSNGKIDAFVRDLDTNETHLVSVGPAGQASNEHAGGGVDLSADGRYVAFGAYPSNWGVDASYGAIWLRDRVANTTTLIKAGSSTFGSAGGARISDDGTVVAFIVSTPSGRNALYAYDRTTSTLNRVDVRSDGTAADGYHISSYDLSSDGNVIAFEDDDSLIANDTNGSNYSDIYVRDRSAGTTRIASVSSTGAQAPNPASNVTLSSDGRFVGFVHYWGTVTPPAPWDAGSDVYVHDMTYGSTWHVGVDGYGQNQASGPAMDGSGLKVAIIASGTSAPLTTSQEIYVASRTPDTTAPGVSALPQTSPNGAGWYDASVPVNWFASDPLPSWGPASTPAPITASTEGTNTYVSGPSCDRAGNCSTGSVTLSIDTIAPVVTVTTPADGATYNYGDTADASYGCSDSGSGLVSCTAAVADGAALDMSVGAHQLSVTATDTAGNTTTVQHDYSVSAAVPSAPQYVAAAAGDATATVSWTAPVSDGGASISQYRVTTSPGAATTLVAGSEASATITGLTNGTAYTFTVAGINSAGPGFESLPSDPVTPQAGAAAPTVVSTVIDPATGGSLSTDTSGTGPTALMPLVTSVDVPAGSVGNALTIAQTASTEVAPTGYAFLGQQVDITAPVATVANPLVIVFRIDPTLAAGRTPAQIDLARAEGTAPSVVVAPCTDPAAGIAAPDPCIVGAYAADGSGDIVLTIFTSRASHWNMAVRSDTTAPSISGTSPTNGATYTYGQSVPVRYTCADEAGGSGLATCSGSITANGSTRSVASTGATVTTTTVGPQTFIVTATDQAGNRGTLTNNYSVVYPFTGFYSPVATNGMTAADAGKIVPLKFSLGGNRGLSVLATSSPTQYPVSCSTGSRTGPDVATVGSLTYDVKAGKYTYSWGTSKSWSGTCRTFKLQLKDGTSHLATFRFGR